MWGLRHSKLNARLSWAWVAAQPCCHCNFGQVPPKLSWQGQGPHDCLLLTHACGFLTVPVLQSLPRALHLAFWDTTQQHLCQIQILALPLTHKLYGRSMPVSSSVKWDNSTSHRCY